jgi:hypothetical protein
MDFIRKAMFISIHFIKIVGFSRLLEKFKSIINTND